MNSSANSGKDFLSSRAKLPKNAKPKVGDPIIWSRKTFFKMDLPVLWGNTFSGNQYSIVDVYTKKFVCIKVKQINMFYFNT